MALGFWWLLRSIVVVIASRYTTPYPVAHQNESTVVKEKDVGIVLLVLNPKSNPYLAV